MSARPPSAQLEIQPLVGGWTLDPRMSRVGLKSTSMWGLAPVKGTFREISGNGTVSPSGEIRGALGVVAASIDTKNARRDRHLRSSDFFDADNHPAITFEATSIQLSGQDITVTGTLTVRGRAVPLSLVGSVTIRSHAEVWLDTEIRIDRADLGLTWSGFGASTLNIVAVHAVFTRR